MVKITIIIIVTIFLLFQRVNLLKQVYKSVEDIDLYVGMTLERPSQNGALVGDTFLCLIGDQFARLKWGDRYFYDLRNQPGSFNLSKYIYEKRALVFLHLSKSQ